MNKKQEGKAEKLFKKLGKKIDGMITDLSDLKKDTGKEFHKRVDEVKRNKESLESELKDFKSKNRHKWDEIEQSLENAAQELRKAFSVAFTNHKKGEEKTEQGTSSTEQENSPVAEAKGDSKKKKSKKKDSSKKATSKKAPKSKTKSSKGKTKKAKK